ncbi:MAG TPA: hypothetical protein VML50_11645 [Anaeromyxobacter sp.]|nr:hypothetical protein [Anaeromyxobacter sp.]
MKGKRLPSLSSTGRRYVEATRRARLASPGVERFEPPRRRGVGTVVVAVLIAAALIGAFLLLAR